MTVKEVLTAARESLSKDGSDREYDRVGEKIKGYMRDVVATEEAEPYAPHFTAEELAQFTEQQAQQFFPGSYLEYRTAGAPAIAPIPPRPPAEPQRGDLVPVSLGEDRAFLERYRALAQKIGYHCAEVESKLDEAELVEYLHEQGIAPYDYKAVCFYMHEVVQQLNHSAQNRRMPSVWGDWAGGVEHEWRWSPLRKCDGEKSELYTKPIPEPVLMTVAGLVERFGERVVLEISDLYTMPKPDPFLAVSVRGGERYVIERWDEPSFRG